MTPFRTLLIANRGEIACRIIRTARRMGLKTVAVYSEADVGALHTRMADTAVCIGAAEARASYLNGAAILEAARVSGAEAIHPGYGFLSENADFIAAVEQAGLIAVAPPSSAIRAMGDKANAKRLMAEAAVPLLPGYGGEAQSDAAFLSAAQDIGFPLILKPAAGGGGKGMKIARALEELPALLASARREAKASFGDERLILERYLEHPRHVEVQIFADKLGNSVHLFERDCTLQRRHQKVIEEAPAPDLSENVRRILHEAALKAAQAVGYVGAGTVEFLLSREGHPSFMEMNTRLQVEHPVTEEITGFDLVEWQLRVAMGEPLPVQQHQIVARGHAFEARLYAEDAAAGFLPQTGTLSHLQFSTNARIETGVQTGDSITIHYDPMIAKVITHGATRAEALAALGAALDETQVVGVTTNRDFLRRLTRTPAFMQAPTDIGWLDRDGEAIATLPKPSNDEAVAQAAALYWEKRQKPLMQNPWQRGDGWRGILPSVRSLVLRDEAGIAHKVSAVADNAQGIICGDVIHVFLNSEDYVFTRIDPLAPRLTMTEGEHHLRAPMPGRVTAVLVKVGEQVERGAPLLVLEAMKMEHTIRAPAVGKILALRYAVGDQVTEGVELVEWEVRPHD